MGGKQSTDTSARASPSSQSKDNNNDIPVLYDMETGLAIMGLDATGRDSDKMKQFREWSHIPQATMRQLWLELQRSAGFPRMS